MGYCLGWNIHDPPLCHFSPSMVQTSVTSMSWNCPLTQEFWDAVGSVVSQSCHVVMTSFVDHLLGAVCAICKLHNSCRYCYHCCCLLPLLLLLKQLLFTYWKKETMVRGKPKNLTMVSLWETEELNWESECCTSNLQPHLLIKSVALHTAKQVKWGQKPESVRWEPQTTMADSG